jgi:hypothetical protein
MKIDIAHGFKFRSHNLTELFDNVNNMSSFMKKLEKQSLKDPLRYDSLKYLGDGFEFFIEIFIKSHAYDNRVGITDYEPIVRNDNGVDGIGKNLIGKKCVIQCKYRSDNRALLTTNQDHIGNMVVEGMMTFNIIKPENKKDCPVYYVFTTATGLHYYTDNEVFKGYVKCFGINELKTMLDGNLSFWNLCREICNNIVDKKV